MIFAALKSPFFDRKAREKIVPIEQAIQRTAGAKLQAKSVILRTRPSPTLLSFLCFSPRSVVGWASRSIHCEADNQPVLGWLVRTAWCVCGAVGRRFCARVFALDMIAILPKLEIQLSVP
jgi:hypothetical protein